MKKHMLIMGILLLAGVSFAPVGPSGPEWNVYKQTCCQAYMLAGNPGIPSYNWAEDIRTSYQTGVLCLPPKLMYTSKTIWNMMWADVGSVQSYYERVASDCSKPTSPECQNAKTNFNQAAKNARSIFAIAKADYLSATRKALYAYKYNYCSTTPNLVSEDISDAMGNYFDCMDDPLEYCFYYDVP
ncbi:hypothetical protein H0O01_03190 [Candidatus Micrarchaeota archaeon]|nr:hypothetical protein [Candidatus Micrarchaeota archaeon]